MGDFLVAIESTFRTIASSAFSELGFIIWFGQEITTDRFSWEFLNTLRRMYVAKPFKLAFSIIVCGGTGEVSGRAWREWVGKEAGGGHLSFLEFPPSVSFI
jgi:hypothetical protein